LFEFRRRLCHAPRGHFDIVRLDQRAVELVDNLMSRWHTDDNTPLSVDEWYRRLRRFLAGNEIILTTPRQTGVQVLEAHEAALFPFRHTFIVHANDGEFPRRPVEGMLFSDEERSLLFEAGIPAPPRDVMLRRERTLWRAVAQGTRVTLTYRTADASGVPLLPSLMVPRQELFTEIRRTDFTWEKPFNQAHLELRAARDIAANRRPRIGHRGTDALRRAVVHAVAELERRGGPEGSGLVAGEPGPWNGLITDPVVLDKLAERFGADRVWSASQLELYAQCPFIFFAERVLYLDELAEVEDETTPLVTGSVSHEILDRFFARYAGKIPADADDAVLALLDQAIHEVFHERESNGDWLGKPVLWEVHKHEIRDRIMRYVAWELPLLDDRRPLKTEYEFGDPEPYVVRGRDVSGNNVELLLRGRIDRVDRQMGGEECYVLDYKLSTTPTGKWYADGSALQMPLYMRAAADLLGQPVASGGYAAIRRSSWTKSRTVAAQVKWGDDAYQRALSIALSVPARVRAGYFEARASGQSKWKSYWTGACAARTDAVVSNGSRFDE
jgi:ATP-dependent helicase/nuclease subunit B